MKKQQKSSEINIEHENAISAIRGTLGYDSTFSHEAGMHLSGETYYESITTLSAEIKQELFDQVIYQKLGEFNPSLTDEQLKEFILILSNRIEENKDAHNHFINDMTQFVQSLKKSDGSRLITVLDSSLAASKLTTVLAGSLSASVHVFYTLLVSMVIKRGVDFFEFVFGQGVEKYVEDIDFLVEEANSRRSYAEIDEEWRENTLEEAKKPE